nr:hypothetical protein [Candidatus Sigynarchaeota archaeon]
MGKAGAVFGGLIAGLVIGVVVGAFVLPGLGLMSGGTTNYTLKIIRYYNGTPEHLEWLPANTGTIEGTTWKNATISFPAGTVVMLNVTAGDVGAWYGANASAVKTVTTYHLFYVIVTSSMEIEAYWI